MPATNQYANAAKKATNVSLAEALLTEAKELRINISQAAEAGLAKAVAEKRAELWIQEIGRHSKAQMPTWRSMGCHWKIQDVLMAKYGVYLNPEGVGYLLDVQEMLTITQYESDGPFVAVRRCPQTGANA